MKKKFVKLIFVKKGFISVDGRLLLGKDLKIIN